jgi:DNA-binding PadR family transcriptional regulator
MTDETQLISKLLPLREPTLFILLSLSRESKHGYAILQEVKSLSNGRVNLSTGTLYGAIGRLLNQGLIQRSAEDKVDVIKNETHISRGRKSYRLTQYGQRVLEGELARMRGLLSTAQQQMGDEAL